MKKAILLFATIMMLVLTTMACNGNLNNNTLEGQNRHVHDQQRALEQEYISSDWTNIPSNQFPHTRAIQVQEAQFEFEIDHENFHQRELFDFDLDIRRDQAQQPEQATPAPEQEWPQQPRQATPAPEQEGPQQPEAGTPEPDVAERPAPAQPEAPAEQPDPEPVEEQQPAEEEEPQQQEREEQQDIEGIGQQELQVIELTNNHRRENGLSELQADQELSNVARRKSTDMQENNYFSHTSPTYGSPFDMIRDFGISYNEAGENIAQGQQSPEQVVQAWMDSPGHRENILNGNFTHIGVGYDTNGHHWTQMFISR